MSWRHSRAAVLGAALLPAIALGACSDSGDEGRVMSGQGYVDATDATVVRVAPDEREPAPDLSGELIGGGTFSLDDVRGDDIVVVNVWGSWCGPCQAEAETLERVSRDLEDDGVMFLGLNTRDQEKAALAFLARHDVTYPNLDDNSALLQLGFRDSLPAATIPTTWVIDREGRVAARTLNGVTEERLRALIQPVLEESDGSASGAAG